MGTMQASGGLPRGDLGPHAPTAPGNSIAGRTLLHPEHYALPSSTELSAIKQMPIKTENLCITVNYAHKMNTSSRMTSDRIPSSFVWAWPLEGHKSHMQELKPRTATTYFSKRLADVVTHPPRMVRVESLLEMVCAVHFSNFCVVREIRGRGDEMHAVDVFMICFDFLEMCDAPNRIDRFPTEQDRIPPPPPPEQYAHVMCVFAHNMHVELDEISPDLDNLDINDPAWSWEETQHSTTDDTLTSNGAAVPSRVPSPAPERTAPPDVGTKRSIWDVISRSIWEKVRAATN